MRFALNVKNKLLELVRTTNALIMGKCQLVKIRDEGAKTNCYLSLFISLLGVFTPFNT